eukprot:CAMPEP_0114289778 /NCGR_PEP_ID=MMETSP0059-20121206/7563_1 /TAXON_ID=36894 /ORGANISM="Pyramimonas parkeae, Strain CCMP726" /LENGTH=36 /DNA_ID= /DNA_START= /DNA_END= /DNA_ORIENTATION=
MRSACAAPMAGFLCAANSRPIAPSAACSGSICAFVE